MILSTAQRRAIDLVKQVASEKDCRPFLVGGPVRDLLLGRKAIDVDLTLEEGSSTLARALARRVEGRVRSYPQFLTYKVTAEGYPEIDIATARKERYRAPGALPAVAPGRLEDDLLRRDFSINAMAMDLLDGSLHDPANGERDLKSGVIRVLHEKSFVDDPTRILRAIRLAKRLGFAIEPRTSELIDAAIKAGALDTVSKERIWRELFLAMDEALAPSVLVELDARGILARLFGHAVAPKSKQLLERVRHQLEDRPDLDRYVLYTGGLLRGLDISAAHLEGSGLSQKRAQAVLQIARELSAFEQSLKGARSDQQRFRLYKTVAPEMLRILAADRPHEGKHIARYEAFQKFTIPLRGNELEVPGGPHVAKALERTREAVFTGEIKPDQAKSFAREMAIKYLESK
jgi:tRNA nucleotidyltransferase/poly(A) polymerase